MKTYKDVYKLPLVWDNTSSWIWDSGGNFVAQYLFYGDDEKAKNLLETINKDRIIRDKTIRFFHEEGEVYVEKDGKVEALILIRGWGNLTSPNCLDLSVEEAENVQDTFAEFIVKQLNRN